MKVEDIMQKNVIWVTPETTIAEVATILFENRFHGVPVMENDKIAGIITESDFFLKDPANLFLPTYIDVLKNTAITGDLSKEKKQEIDKFFQTKAKDIMTKKCMTVSNFMKLEDLLIFFKETKFTTLPVVDESEKLAGIVTLSDIIGLIKIKS